MGDTTHDRRRRPWSQRRSCSCGDWRLSHYLRACARQSVATSTRLTTDKCPSLASGHTVLWVRGRTLARRARRPSYTEQSFLRNYKILEYTCVDLGSIEHQVLGRVRQLVGHFSLRRSDPQVLDIEFRYHSLGETVSRPLHFLGRSRSVTSSTPAP